MANNRKLYDPSALRLMHILTAKVNEALSRTEINPADVNEDHAQGDDGSLDSGENSIKFEGAKVSEPGDQDILQKYFQV